MVGRQGHVVKNGGVVGFTGAVFSFNRLAQEREQTGSPNGIDVQSTQTFFPLHLLLRLPWISRMSNQLEFQTRVVLASMKKTTALVDPLLRTTNLAS